MKTPYLPLLISLLLLSIIPSNAEEHAELPPISIERQAELLYLLKQDCGSCHGMTLQGGLGTPLLPENLANKPPEFLIQTILDGRPNTAMPPWRALLTESEITWLVNVLLAGTALESQE